MRIRLLAVGLTITLAASWAFCGRPPSPNEGETYAAAKTKALAATEEEFAQIASAHPGDQGIARLRERLAAMDRAVGLVVKRLEWARAASMEKWIGDLPARPGTISAHTIAAVRAADIIRDSADDFCEALPAPGVTAAERDLLVRHYDAAVSAASAYVAGRAEAVARLDAKAGGEAVQLALVLPLLMLPDERWGDEDVAALPAWVRAAGRLPIAEAFALAANRPRAAYAFAMFGRRSAAGPGGGSTAAAPLSSPLPSPAEYLRATAARLSAQRDHATAIRCLRAGIPAAEAEKRAALVIELRENLAATYEQTGQPDLAAEEMKRQLGGPLQGEQYARSAMLRLKYLYAADRFQDAAREAATYQSDERCKPYLPQVLYIQWITLRRSDRAEEANRVQALFLDHFPENLLGADMYFANAMTALATSDYDEAVRQLETIETRYPKSSLIPRVKEICARLAQSGTGP